VTNDLNTKTLLATDADLMARRQKIRSDLVRSNTATLVALLISVSLAGATVFFAFEAQQASTRMREELWNSQRAQATALRLSAKVGRRLEGLKAIAEAVRIRPSPELRDEAIATLPLVDVEPGTFWQALPPEDSSVAVSFQNQLIATGDVAGRVRVQRMTDHVEVATLTLSSRIMSLEFSPNGRWLAAHAQAGGLRLWDAMGSRTIREFQGESGEFNEHSLSFSPDSGWLAVCAPGEAVRLIDTNTGEEGPPIAVGSKPAAACFDASGEWLAVGAENRIHIWNMATRKLQRTLNVQNRVLDLAWHPFSKHFALATGDGSVVLVSPEGRTLLTLRGHTALVNRVLFDRSGAVLVSTSWDGTTRFWSAHSGWPLLVSQAGFARQFDPSGERLVYVKEGSGVGDWRFTSGTAFRTLALPRDAGVRTFALDFSPDDRWLAVATLDGIHLLDCQTTRWLGTVKLPGSGGVAFAVDGKSILARNTAGVHRIPYRTLPEPGTVELGSPTLLVELASLQLELGFTTRGKRHWFVTGNTTNVAVVELAQPENVRVLPLPGDGSSLAISPDGQFVATSVWKGSGTRVWRLDEPGPPRALGDEGGLAVFSPDGRWLVVGTGGSFLMHDTVDWRLRREVRRDTASALSGVVAFDREGRTMAVTHTLRQIRLLETATGRPIGTLDAPTPERITSMSFSGDGRLLAAATSNAEVHLWKLDELRQGLRGLGLDLSAEGSWRVEGKPEIPAPWRPHRLALWLSGLGAGLVLLFAFYSIRHHRGLVHAYEAVEVLAEARRKEVETTHAHLVHSQKMNALGTLAAGIAHDFNNLLSVIRMSGQLVRLQLDPAGLARENLDAIERAVCQGRTIVGSILGFTGRSRAPQQSYTVSRVVSETLSMLNAQYLSGMVLNLELASSEPQLRGDKARLGQILLNLIMNANEAMKGVGSLTVSVRVVDTPAPCLLAPHPASAYVELRVRDTGPGIAPEIMPRLFEPFFTTKTGSGEHGTGLGLTTVYAVARQDGFGLGVESLAGQGATFRVLVPVHEMPAPPG
jgi:signal transduction histidine kinase